MGNFKEGGECIKGGLGKLMIQRKVGMGDVY